MIKVYGMALLLAACGCGACSSAGSRAQSAPAEAEAPAASAPAFDADSAYAYVQRQTEFGPRVPGTPGHRECGSWLEAELRRHGLEVTVQEAELTAFDGTRLPARNIMGRLNPQAEERTLLLAHWDTRPWADQDPDEANHKTPILGANDGASGVGVLLEVARQLAAQGTDRGVDILFVDAEDYGTEGDDTSWALGARHFADNPPIAGYRPARAVLVDMVGGEGAVFRREYFSQQNAPGLVDALWAAAAQAGHGARFSNDMGGAITDDHLEFQRQGIPAVDIIAYDPESGFPPEWHTLADNMDAISRPTLQAVGATLLQFIKSEP